MKSWYKTAKTVHEYRISAASDDMGEDISSYAQSKGYTVSAHHGTSHKIGLSETNQFSPDLLGLSTNAKSAQEGFFFAKNKGTAAEYALLEAAETPYGDWFWEPKNANDVLGHLRDLMLGFNVSGNNVDGTDDKLDSIWSLYGDTIQSFLNASSSEERMSVYNDFRNASLHENIIDEIDEQVQEQSNEAALISAWGDIQFERSNNSRIHELNREKKTLEEKNISKWKEWSTVEQPETIHYLERWRLLIEAHPEDTELQRVGELMSEITNLESMPSDTREWTELSDDEQRAFLQDEYAEEKVDEYRESIAEEEMAKSLKIFSNQNANDPSIFEWENGFDPSDHSLDSYFLKVENPYVKQFDDSYRDETFANVMEQAKSEGYDSVIFKDIKDGGGVDDIYAVFSPNQIKSAEPTTYDAAGKEIPLSNRFDESNNDLRY